MKMQLDDMAALSLIPDEVRIQSQSSNRHLELLKAAIASGLAYPCDCSRKDVQSALEGAASAPHGSLPVYSGRCRPMARRRQEREARAADQSEGEGLGIKRKAESIAWRFRMPDESGRDDVIIARTRTVDGTTPTSTGFIPSYHWACAIDDHDGAYPLLVRASDLADSAAPQRAIQAWLRHLDKRTDAGPAIYHTALIVNDDGHRLEKRTLGVTWPELRNQGMQAKDLLRLFTQSFADHDLTSLPHPGSSAFEKPAVVSLRGLGIKLSATDAP